MIFIQIKDSMTDIKNPLKKKFGQFDTPLHIASKLWELSAFKEGYFVDCGAGLGNLSSPLHHQPGLMIEWDIDRHKALEEKGFNTRHQNFLSEDLELDFPQEKSDTIFLSNPPFHKESNIYNFKYFESLLDCTSKTQIDVAFLDRVASIAKQNDSLLFIMSSPFFESECFSSARKQIIEKYHSIKIVSLPERLFECADVQSYALIATNQSEPKSTFELFKMDSNGSVIAQIKLNKDDASQNLNFNFQEQYEEIRGVLKQEYPTLKELGCEIVRGSLSKNQFMDLGIKNFIHTSNLNDASHLKGFIYPNQKIRTATQDDILIPRIGGRIIERAHLVKANQVYFTESVYRIRVPKDHADAIWTTLSSEFGQKWRKAHTQGKCAKFLTMDSLYNMPIITESIKK